MEERQHETRLVADADEFEDFLDAIEGEERLAIDTEANSMHAYRARLCLIQCSTRHGDWVLDPLAPIDFDPFFAVLEDERVTKVFHDAEFDVLLLNGEHDVRLRGLFDTKVVATALGETQYGLASLVERRFGAKLDKSQQRSDWGKRPLEEVQIRYAADDTRYLLDLADELEGRLDASDELRQREVRAEFRRLEGLVAKKEARDPDDWARLKGAHLLEAKERVILREFWRWREAVAEKRNQPPFKILGNAQLLAIARSRPVDVAALARIEGVGGRLLERYASTWLGILTALRDHPGIAKPTEPQRSAEQRKIDREDVEALERLKRWRKAVADERRTDPSLVMHREVLERLSRVRPRPTSREELEVLGDFEAWRLNAYSEALLGVLAGIEGAKPRAASKVKKQASKNSKKASAKRAPRAGRKG